MEFFRKLDAEALAQEQQNSKVSHQKKSRENTSANTSAAATDPYSGSEYERRLAAAKARHAREMKSLSQGKSSEASQTTADTSEYQARVNKLRTLLTSPAPPGGALERLLNIGSTCERIKDLDFVPLATQFCRQVRWAEDASCGDWDVQEMLKIVDKKPPAELRQAVEECVEDGGLHLRPILDLSHADMKASFFLELLEAAARETAVVPATALPPKRGIARAFALFATASDAPEAQAAFLSLLSALGLATAPGLAELCTFLLPVLPHRSRQLLSLLAARVDRTREAAASDVRHMKVLIIGAGPCGLRTAIELAAMGAEVEVLESRDSFSRLQVVALWDWLEQDLIELGIKLLDPSIFIASDLRRCQTCQLQHSLHKVALLLGVTVRFGARVHTVEDLAALRRGKPPVTVLVDASGARCQLLATLGFGREVGLKSARALCIVLSLANDKTPEELELRESTWSAQYSRAFRELGERCGVWLENCVYYRSTGAFSTHATHYFLLTTSLESLAAFGALRDPAPINAAGEALDPCQRDNVDLPKLEAYARFGIEAFVPPLAHKPLVSPSQLSVFDFSQRTQSSRAAALAPAAALGVSSPLHSHVLVTRVGDALQEPFWPEGLGINRGFLGAYDCAWMVQAYAAAAMNSGSQSAKASTRPEPMSVGDVLARREALFAALKVVSAHNRQLELRPHVDVLQRFCYTFDPLTRYKKLAAAATDGEDLVP